MLGRVIRGELVIGKRRNRRSSNYDPRIESLEPRALLAADPMIAEFQAINESTIQDADGDFSDWIEIQNTNAEPLNVGGWYLTDDATELTKWQLPSVTIPAGKEILVFASGKDRADAASELHANFRLTGNGEYLALVKPDGITVSQDFGSKYPEQLADQSYGLGVARDSFLAIERSSAVSVHVPTNDLLATTWTTTDFDDATWTAGTTAVGYEVLKPGTTETFEFDAPLAGDWTVDIPDGARGTVNVVGGALNITVPINGQDADPEERGLAPLVYRDFPGEDATDWEVITHVQQDDASRGNAGILIYDQATGKPAVMLEHRSTRNFRLTSGTTDIDERIATGSEYFLRLVRDEFAKSWTGYYKYEAGEEWSELGSLTDGVDGAAVVVDPKPGLIARTPSSTMEANFQSFEVIVKDQRTVYRENIGLDVEADLRQNNGSIYMRMPFTIAGDPSRFDELDLTASFDDGFRAYLNGDEVVAQNVPIDATWDSVATSQHGAVAGRIPVQQFDLAQFIGSLKVGQNVLAVHGMNVDQADTDFFFDATLIASDFQPLSEQVFIDPTPGAPNLLPSAPTPEILTENGVFFGSQTVEMRIEEVAPTLEIRYTLDGTDPTPDSLLYTAPIVLTASSMLQARTFDSLPISKFEPSNAASATFFALAEELRNRDSDIPILILDSLGQGLPGSASTSLVGMNVILFDVSDATGRASVDGIVDYLGRGGARDRGSSTANLAKPNMAFETWGPTGTTQDDDDNVSLLGMPADSDWVFYSPFSFDRALIRNQMAFELSNQMNLWATDYRNVEVYLNVAVTAGNKPGDGIVAEDDYMGVYALLEKISQGPHRVDVASISPDVTEEPDISGGYIWKVDRGDPGEPGFNAGGQGMQWVYPKSPASRTARPDQKATEQQQDWVIEHFNAFRDTLAEPDINDPEGYSKFIDTISWVDHHMHNVFIMNVDALRLSAYFQKDRNQKIVYGPVWDFDRAAESNDNRDDNPNVWRSELGDMGTDFFGNGTQRWWGDLFQDPGFWQLYVDRWQMWRDSVLSDENVGAVIDALADEVRESAERNFAARVNRSVQPRGNSGYENNVLDETFQGEVENIKTWLRERAAFMDNNFAKKPDLLIGGELLPNLPGSKVDAGTQVEIAAPDITFFDDTVLISGEPDAAMGSYFVPTNNDLGETWAAPGFDDAAWQTGPLGVGYDERDTVGRLVRTEIIPKDIMAGATTILTRVDFEINDLADIKNRQLLLQAKFDDGYVGYLNGVEITRQSIRDDDLAWDSRASTRQAPATPLEFAEVDLSEFSDLLVEGTNVLGLRLINRSGTDRDILMLPQLVGRQVLSGKSPEATVYFTTDGTDPRGPDGNPSASAVEAIPGEAVTINANTRIISRNFDTINRGPESAIVLTNWSGPREDNFVVQTPQLQITEINYNPADPTDVEQNANPDVLLTSGDFEFVEIYNAGSEAASLTSIELSDGVEFDFTTSGTTTLDPGAYVLVVANNEAFNVRYGNDLPVAGQFAGNLNNNGEDIDLIEGTGTVLFTVNYGDNDPWPVRPDGIGASLELVDPSTTTATTQSKYYAWRGSTEWGGSPGTAGSGPMGVVINEVLAHTESGNLTDSIELHNTTDAAVNIGGWYLSDVAGDLQKYQIPADTILQAGQYVVYNESHFNGVQDDAKNFALSGDRGDSVYLTAPDGNGGLLFVDDVHFRETADGQTLARLPNGSGRLFPSASDTLGAENTAHRPGSVVVMELNYNPGPPSAAAMQIDPTLTDNDLEFVEIINATDTGIDLTNWRVRGGVDFDFGDGTQLAAGERIVLVKFNPENPENINRLNGFKAHYDSGDDFRILGGYGGRLNNSDDKVQILRPTDPPVDRPNFIPRVLEDEVLYDDFAPWPVGADGTGNSLNRTSAGTYGNDGASWIAAAPSPGGASGDLPGDFDNSGVVDVVDVNLLLEQLRADEPDVGFDLTNDGQVDAADRDFMIQTILGTNYGDANLDGAFESRDLVTVFVAGEYEDGIAGNSTWEEGDWDGDGDFASGDLVLAFQAGAYEQAARIDTSMSRVGAAVYQIKHGKEIDPLSDHEIANAFQFADPGDARQELAPAQIDEVFDQYLTTLYAEDEDDLDLGEFQI